MYQEVIDSIVQAMIISQQRNYTRNDIKEVIRTHWKGVSEHQVRTCLDKLKQDSRIAVQKVSQKKIYISYKGVV